MKNRLCADTGLGSGVPDIFNNEIPEALKPKIVPVLRELDRELFHRLKRYTKHLKEYPIDGAFCFDHNIYIGDDTFIISMGIEPTYQRDPYFRFEIKTNINLCSVSEGVAWEYYGTGIACKKRYFKDYKNESYWRNMLAKYHKKLSEALKEQ